MNTITLAVGAVGLLALVLATVEISLRMLGMHRPVLYERTDFGYRIRPGQDLTILGKRSFYNSMGLRSKEVSALPAAGRMRILCVGDSITNGGSRADQDETYPSFLSSLLEQDGRDVEVLNISASGWALENELKWLQRFGTLGSQWVIQQVATHDLHQDFVTSDVVDSQATFPSAHPGTALGYLFARFVKPRLNRLSSNDPGVDAVSRESEDLRRSLAHLDAILALVRRAGASLMVVLVEQPEKHEPKDAYANAAKLALASWARENDVPLVLTADRLSRGAGHEDNFRDVIHPNETGNRILAQCVFQELSRVQALRAQAPTAEPGCAQLR